MRKCGTAAPISDNVGKASWPATCLLLLSVRELSVSRMGCMMFATLRKICVLSLVAYLFRSSNSVVVMGDMRLTLFDACLSTVSLLIWSTSFPKVSTGKANILMYTDSITI